MSDTGNSPELDREAALLSWIQKSAPYGIITLDTSFKVQSWNRWMETHSARRSEEVVGKDLFALFPDLHERQMEAPLDRALKGEYGVLSTSLHHHFLALPSHTPSTGVMFMRQTTRIAPLLSNGVVCGVVVVIDDVTDRETQAEILNRQNRRLEILSWILAQLMTSDAPWKTMRQLFFKIAEHMDLDTFLLYLRDPDTGVFNLYTAGGVSPESEKDFADYPLLSRLAESDEKVIFDSVQERRETEFAALQKAGVRALVAIPLVTNGRHLGLLCFATWSREHIAKDESDLLAVIAQYLAVAADRERTNHQLQKAKEQLVEHAQVLERRVEERTARLQDTISELQMFSYTLAHDLKAPVRGMVGYSQILMKNFAGSLPPEAMAIVQRLERIPRRMEVLIKDLLEFSKVSRQEVVMDRVEIEPIIDEIVGLRASDVRQAITIRPPLHAVRAQRDLLQQVLSNLVDNAIKFVAPQMPPRITIFTEVVTQGSHSIRSGKLLFSSSESPPIKTAEPPAETPPIHMRIWVEDEGIGIPGELHQKIFGIFERGADAEQYEGTGMGLAIVARALQRMGDLRIGIRSLARKPVLDRTSRSMKRFTRCRLAGLLLMCAVSACNSPPARLHVQQTTSQYVRNNTYSLLYQLLNEEKDVSKLRFIKRENEDLKSLIKRVSASAKAGASQIEEFAKRDPSLALDQFDLPPGEKQTRASISSAEEKDLLLDSGGKFELVLILSQIEALSYASHLAQVASQNDSQGERVRFLSDLSSEMKNFHDELVAHVSER